MTSLEAALQALGEALEQRDEFKRWWLDANAELSKLKEAKEPGKDAV